MAFSTAPRTASTCACMTDVDEAWGEQREQCRLLTWLRAGHSCNAFPAAMAAAGAPPPGSADENAWADKVLASDGALTMEQVCARASLPQLSAACAQRFALCCADKDGGRVGELRAQRRRGACGPASAAAPSCWPQVGRLKRPHAARLAARARTNARRRSRYCSCRRRRGATRRLPRLRTGASPCAGTPTSTLRRSASARTPSSCASPLRTTRSPPPTLTIGGAPRGRDAAALAVPWNAAEAALPDEPRARPARSWAESFVVPTMQSLEDVLMLAIKGARRVWHACVLHAPRCLRSAALEQARIRSSWMPCCVRVATTGHTRSLASTSRCVVRSRRSRLTRHTSEALHAPGAVERGHAGEAVVGGRGRGAHAHARAGGRAAAERRRAVVRAGAAPAGPRGG